MANLGALVFVGVHGWRLSDIDGSGRGSGPVLHNAVRSKDTVRCLPGCLVELWIWKASVFLDAWPDPSYFEQSEVGGCRDRQMRPGKG